MEQKSILNSGWVITWRACDNNAALLKYYETITQPRHKPLHIWKGVEAMVNPNFKHAVDDVKPTDDMPKAERLERLGQVKKIILSLTRLPPGLVHEMWIE